MSRWPSHCLSTFVPASGPLARAFLSTDGHGSGEWFLGSRQYLPIRGIHILQDRSRQTRISSILNGHADALYIYVVHETLARTFPCRDVRHQCQPCSSTRSSCWNIVLRRYGILRAADLRNTPSDAEIQFR